jgi:large repetitive protein
MRMTISRTLILPALAMMLMLASTAFSQQSVTYGYDQLGRITTVTYADGKQIVYNYDAAGNRTQHIVSASTVNRPPVAVDDAKTASEGVAYVFDPRTNDSDPDGNPITITNVSNGQYGAASVGGGGTSVTYTATAGRVGTDLITYSISDGTSSVSAAVTLTIANSPPTPVTDAISVNRGANPGITFDPRTNDTDPGLDPFTITAKTNGTKGTVTLGAGGTSVTYKPTPPLYGSDSFTYTITDDAGGAATGTVNVTINYVNTAPTANTDLAYKVVHQGNFNVTIDPRTNDVDGEGDPMTITAKTNGTYGTVTILSSGTLVKYQRTSNYPALYDGAFDTFTYTISDGQGGTSVGTVNVNVDHEPNCGTEC